MPNIFCWQPLENCTAKLNNRPTVHGLPLDNIQGGAKNGATLSHCKYSENFMTELRGNW